MRELIEARLKNILADIEAAKSEVGRTDHVQLVGVSKFQSYEKIKIALELGLRDFGENYVKEGISKIEEMQAAGLEANFHFIGALQSNKVKEAVRYFDVIQSIESIKQVEAICKALSNGDKKTQKILIQVNVSQEGQKSGVEIAEVGQLLSYVLTKPQIELRGLMAIGSFTEDLNLKVSEFRALRALRDKLELDFSCKLPELSMGMSEDFKPAVKEGATIVRIGSLLFGDRDKNS